MTGVCQAPAVSLYFEVDGSILACCHNRLHPLGLHPRDRLEDVWRGAAAAELRSALADGDLRRGCEACAFEIRAGNRAGATAATFDGFEAGAWPHRLEFALSNRCNLACVMCNGSYSSRIRAEREQLPPLRSPYGEDFFEQLRPFLPHVRQARFYGGEPFLVPEYQRIWDLLTELNDRCECNVTTNGTVRTTRTEAWLESLPFSIGVSVDGMTQATVERIRQGADFRTVMANVRWFRDYTAERGTWFGLTYCLMTANWREFGDFLLFADDLDAGVAVNRVTQPAQYSLFHLDPADLGAIVSSLEHQGRQVRSRLSKNRAVWDAQLEVLRTHLSRSAREPGRPTGLNSVIEGVLDAKPFDSAQELMSRLLALGAPNVDLIRTDQRDLVQSVTENGLLGTSPQEAVGRPPGDVLGDAAHRLGPAVQLLDDRTETGMTVRAVRLSGGSRSMTMLMVTIPDPAGDGCIHAVADTGLDDAPESEPLVIRS